MPKFSVGQKCFFYSNCLKPKEVEIVETAYLGLEMTYKITPKTYGNEFAREYNLFDFENGKIDMIAQMETDIFLIECYIREIKESM